MIRQKYSVTVQELLTFKSRLLAFSAGFEVSCILDSNEISAALGKNNYELLAGIGSKLSFSNTENDFSELKKFHEAQKDWLFGVMPYSNKSNDGNKTSNNQDLFFFQPLIVITITSINSLEWQVTILSELNPELVYSNIMESVLVDGTIQPASFAPVISKDQYINTISEIRSDIENGDYYELNFCQEFRTDQKNFDSELIYSKLCAKSPAPFSALLKIPGYELVCMSPERFLSHQQGSLVAQPIKGTRRRGANAEEDEKLMNELFFSEKERAENVMIVDLTRNDLSNVCPAGNVKVTELFGIYKFPHVIQMISTVEGQLKVELVNDKLADKVLQNELNEENINSDLPFKAIDNCFPMGSMTGAPKVEVMKRIAKYETGKRGFYSGCIGYISPEGDFDFNVVIRTLIYNKTLKQLSYWVGRAITFDSNSEEEYEECLLKAKGILS
ncbi:MAG: anthranilate synthase component I family protein, partial [Bacteroidia bacterium]|nr:anthranilate synthase component I family protein [Bacteroidia bacterium]